MKLEKWKGLGQLGIYKAVGRNFHFVRLYLNLIVEVPTGDNQAAASNQTRGQGWAVFGAIG